MCRAGRDRKKRFQEMSRKWRIEKQGIGEEG
jgi:hypothetical protein